MIEFKNWASLSQSQLISFSEQNKSEYIFWTEFLWADLSQAELVFIKTHLENSWSSFTHCLEAYVHGFLTVVGWCWGGLIPRIDTDAEFWLRNRITVIISICLKRNLFRLSLPFNNNFFLSLLTKNTWSWSLDIFIKSAINCKYFKLIWSMQTAASW